MYHKLFAIKNNVLTLLGNESKHNAHDSKYLVVNISALQHSAHFNQSGSLHYGHGQIQEEESASSRSDFQMDSDNDTHK